MASTDNVEIPDGPSKLPCWADELSMDSIERHLLQLSKIIHKALVDNEKSLDRKNSERINTLTDQVVSWSDEKNKEPSTSGMDHSCFPKRE